MFGVIPSLTDHLTVNSCIPNHNRKDRVSRTWVGSNIGQQEWENKDYNESPVIVSNVWLPKDDPRWDKVNEVTRIAKENAKKDKKENF